MKIPFNAVDLNLAEVELYSKKIVSEINIKKIIDKVAIDFTDDDNKRKELIASFLNVDINELNNEEKLKKLNTEYQEKKVNELVQLIVKDLNLKEIEAWVVVTKIFQVDISLSQKLNKCRTQI